MLINHKTSISPNPLYLIQKMAHHIKSRLHSFQIFLKGAQCGGKLCAFFKLALSYIQTSNIWLYLTQSLKPNKPWYLAYYDLFIALKHKTFPNHVLKLPYLFLKVLCGFMLSACVAQRPEEFLNWCILAYATMWIRTLDYLCGSNTMH